MNCSHGLGFQVGKTFRRELYYNFMARRKHEVRLTPHFLNAFSTGSRQNADFISPSEVYGVVKMASNVN